MPVDCLYAPLLAALPWLPPRKRGRDATEETVDTPQMTIDAAEVNGTVSVFQLILAFRMMIQKGVFLCASANHIRRVTRKPPEHEFEPALPGGAAFVLDDAVLLQALVNHWSRSYACRPALRGNPSSVAAQDYRCAKQLNDARGTEPVIWGGRATDVHSYPAAMRESLLV